MKTASTVFIALLVFLSLVFTLSIYANERGGTISIVENGITATVTP